MTPSNSPFPYTTHNERAERLRTFAADLQDAREKPLGPIERVWDHYVKVMNPRRKELDQQTRTLVREALKVATVDELCRAVDGCRASAFHMGYNERKKKYNHPSQILKGKRGIRTTREQIDLFLDLLEENQPTLITSGTPARITRAMEALKDPARRQEAEAYLRREGYDPDSLLD